MRGRERGRAREGKRRREGEKARKRGMKEREREGEERARESESENERGHKNCEYQGGVDDALGLVMNMYDIWKTLQRTATRCITRQHTATRCNTLQHTATRYDDWHLSCKLSLALSLSRPSNTKSF